MNAGWSSLLPEADPGRVQDDSSGGSARLRIDEEHLARIRRERDFFGKLAGAGDELYWAETTAVAPVRRKMRSRRIAARAGLVPGEGLRILDIGCGIASCTLPLASPTSAVQNKMRVVSSHRQLQVPGIVRVIFQKRV